MLLAKHSPKSIGILSLFLGMVGIVGAVTMVLTWVTLPLIAVIAAAGMFAFGAGAYVTGYASVLSHPKEAMGVIGYVIGILECLPLILVIDFVFGAISIGKFVFRRKHKSHTDNLSTQVK